MDFFDRILAGCYTFRGQTIDEFADEVLKLYLKEHPDMGTKTKPAPVAMTPGRKAYARTLDLIAGDYDEFKEGNAEDDDFTTPGKQKKVAKQLAKLHNRLLKRSKIQDIDELDEDV